MPEKGTDGTEGKGREEHKREKGNGKEGIGKGMGRWGNKREMEGRKRGLEREMN